MRAGVGGCVESGAWSIEGADASVPSCAFVPASPLLTQHTHDPPPLQKSINQQQEQKARMGTPQVGMSILARATKKK